MAFPKVLQRSGGLNPSATTSHSVTLPSNPATGNLLLVVVGRFETADITTSSVGWSRVIMRAADTRGAIAVFAGVAGVAGALTLTTASSVTSAHYAWEISDWSGNVGDIVSASNVGQVSQAHAPTLTPPAGPKDYLWIVGYGAGWGSQGSVSSGPSGWANFRNQLTGSSTGADSGVAVAEREMNSPTMVPGYFSAGTRPWATVTLAIAPGESVASGSFFQFF